VSRQIRVLVADDERNLRELIVRELARRGHDVDGAEDGVAALERARTLRPAIVISEILIPRMDGLTLCRTLKSDPRTQAIIILLFSHLSAEDRALEAGADAFLIKPIDDRALVDILSKLIAKHEESLRREP